MPPRRGIEITAALALVAPGTALRDGLDRVVKAKRGALLVVGDDADVLAICSGGFLMDAEFTPQRLAELCKMDSAIILTADASRIARANVHLVPDPSVHTTETGTRHRTRGRRRRVPQRARDLGERGHGRHHRLRGQCQAHPGGDPPAPRPRQPGPADAGAVQGAPGRRRDVLTALEIEDLVTLRDVAAMLQRSETVRRVAEQIQTNIVELGAEAHLIRLQMDELLEDVDDDRELVLLDYLPDDRDERLDSALATLAALSTDELLDLRAVAATRYRVAMPIWIWRRSTWTRACSRVRLPPLGQGAPGVRGGGRRAWSRASAPCRS